MNIVLAGMPGCGKSTVGGALSKMLKRELLDTDALIVEKHGDISAKADLVQRPALICVSPQRHNAATFTVDDRAVAGRNGRFGKQYVLVYGYILYSR